MSLLRKHTKHNVIANDHKGVWRSINRLLRHYLPRNDKIISRIKIATLAIFTSIALSSCGFTPVYKTMDENSTNAKSLAAIEVQSSHDLMGQFYSNKLGDLLNPTAIKVEPKYRIKTELNKNKIPFAIQQDRTITRYKLVVIANYQLVDITNGKVIDKGILRREGGYDKVDSDYATYISDEDTTRRIVKELAEDTRIRIMASLIK